MTLLFDANLSPRLVVSLSDDYPRSSHVFDHQGLEHSDQAIWRHAGAAGLTIVSKDTDFVHMSLVFGPPPKCIWLAVGNASTQEVSALLRANRETVESFLVDGHSGLLILRRQI